MAKAAITCILGIVLVGCGDISRIDDDGNPPAATGSMVAGPADRADPTSTHRVQTTTRTPTAFPTNDPLAGASAAQTWRLTQQNNAIARVPSTQSVPQSDINELRRQRMQAEAIAASGVPARPVLGAGSGNGTFAFPTPAASPTLSRAISRAGAAEASAINR